VIYLLIILRLVVMLDLGAPVFALYASNTRLQQAATKHLGCKPSVTVPSWTGSVTYSSTKDWQTYAAMSRK
jgi:hypothetical protein